MTTLQQGERLDGDGGGPVPGEPPFAGEAAQATTGMGSATEEGSATDKGPAAGGPGGEIAIAAAAVLPDRLLRNARVLPDRYAMLPLLPRGRVFVEVGVATGDFSAEILRVCQPSRFVAIDDFRFHTWPMRWAGRPVAEIFAGRSHVEYYRERFAAEIAADRVLVMQDDSARALENLGDSTVDVVYLDADHAYESVRRELAIVRRKLRPDGVIVLNDYTMVDIVGPGTAPYGVIQAAHEFMVEYSWEMTHLALQPYMYCDVAIRRVVEPDGRSRARRLAGAVLRRAGLR